ncbi:flagellar protein FliT [Exilibacterium tricleocarpae]|uniref:Flagellar protein FliT n=1 Tax=Exilibacterium tricleocarpae TaxID=2591008 RepID=A0A545U3U9_9GAMM|nr:flagellar protein FliT [Exilibacterium tricleocarpae]TQV84140.1 flagellar protein FliT [Exilibacterium tricleocarpae]
MSDSQRQQIAKAVSLSRAMLKAAQREQWEDFSELDRARGKLFEAALAPAIPAAIHEFAIQSVQQIQALDARILPLAEAGKAVMGTSLAALRKGKKASALYAPK